MNGVCGREVESVGNRKASPDTVVSQCQVSDEVDEKLEAGVDFIVGPLGGVRWCIVDGEGAWVECEEGEDLGEGIQFEEVFGCEGFPSVVEGALEQYVVSVM